MSRTYTLETGTATGKVIGEETNSAYSIIEYTAKPGHARYLLLHRNMVEAFLVISGQRTF